MLKIFLSFVSDITQKFFDPKLLRNRGADKFLRLLVKTIISYCEIYEYLINFKKMWCDWLDNGCAYELYYNDLTSNITGAITDLMDNYDNIRRFLIYEDAQLFEKSLFFIGCKNNIFEMWKFIAGEIDFNRCFHDNKNKIIYIPNYNLLLTTSKPLTECTHDEVLTTQKVYENAKYCCVFHDTYKATRLWPAFEMIKYVPNLFPELLKGYNTKYVMALRIPDDLPYIHEFINITNDAINQLSDIIEQSKGIIEKYVAQEKKDLLNIIIKASSKNYK